MWRTNHWGTRQPLQKGAATWDGGPGRESRPTHRRGTEAEERRLLSLRCKKHTNNQQLLQTMEETEKRRRKELKKKKKKKRVSIRAKYHCLTTESSPLWEDSPWSWTNNMLLYNFNLYDLIVLCPPANQQYKRMRRYIIAKDNLAITMMQERATALNISDCWICQHLPTSSQTPMVMPLPLTVADLKVFRVTKLQRLSQTVKFQGQLITTDLTVKWTSFILSYQNLTERTDQMS